MPTREKRAKSLGVSVNALVDGRGKHKNHVRGSAHHRWNEGRIVNDDGYVKVRVGVHHPLADPNGYAYEHLVVWCAAARQRPADNEILHHKNEDKADNRLDNLELLTRSAHNALHVAERGRRSNGKFEADSTLDGREWNDMHRTSA